MHKSRPTIRAHLRNKQDIRIIIYICVHKTKMNIGVSVPTKDIIKIGLTQNNNNNVPVKKLTMIPTTTVVSSPRVVYHM